MLKYRSMLKHAPQEMWIRSVPPGHVFSQFFFIGVSSPFDDTVPPPPYPQDQCSSESVSRPHVRRVKC